VLKFITGKPLWINILVGVLLVIILLFLFLQSLDWITRHGKNLTIPAVTGKSFADAKQVLESKGFEVEIQDSVYVDSVPAQSVLRQFPDADASVKVNRTVYLTINRSVPPIIEMPNLEGLSFRSAEMTLRQYGLKMGDTSYRQDFAKNNVLEMQYNDARIKPGTKISMGSTISLVLGDGQGKDEFTVPDLYSMQYGEAKIMLQASGLNITVNPSPSSEIKDTMNAYIYQQNPVHMTPDKRVNRIRQGQNIEVWLQTDRPAPLQIDTTTSGR